MKFLLDSNILILAGLGVGSPLRDRLADCDEGDLATSAVAYAEVVFGSLRGMPPAPARLAALIEEVPVLPFDDKAARVYASLPFRRASFERLIAAHALSLDLAVVTENVTDFADVPGLRVENWTLPLA